MGPLPSTRRTGPATGQRAIVVSWARASFGEGRTRRVVQWSLYSVRWSARLGNGAGMIPSPPDPQVGQSVRAETEQPSGAETRHTLRSRGSAGWSDQRELQSPVREAGRYGCATGGQGTARGCTTTAVSAI